MPERRRPGEDEPEMPRTPPPGPEVPGRTGAPPGREIPELPPPEPELPARDAPPAPEAQGDPNRPGR